MQRNSEQKHDLTRNNNRSARDTRTDIILIAGIPLSKMSQKFNFCLCLEQEWLFRLDDFDSNVFVVSRVNRSNDLTEGSFSYSFLDDIMPIKQLSTCHNIVIVIVIPPIVVGTLSLMCLLSSPRGSPCVSLLIIHAVNMFVRVNQ